MWLRSVTAAVKPAKRELGVIVTCKVCGFRQELERKITQPGYVFLRCHGCEAFLRVTIPTDRFPVYGVDYDLPR